VWLSPEAISRFLCAVVVSVVVEAFPIGIHRCVVKTS
jgi:hypothetical protein